ncbi:MAG: copper resistance protein NlpE N-terminal domain-containing protein [Weeksellaceae bacterium]|nr:copper resistance protein NlpE N-terminal domain-containing protein [Weeksellaceae bacterium]
MPRQFIAPLIVLVVLMLSSCSSDGKSDPTKPQVMELNEIWNILENWQGIYSGTLPIEDTTAIGIDVNLELRPDSTYLLHLTTLHDNPADNDTNQFAGNIEWDNDNQIIVLKDLDTISDKLKIVEEGVEVLNYDRSPKDGKLAEFFVLKRKK